MKKIIGLGLLVVGLGFGQEHPVNVTTINNTAISASTTITTGALQNTGQTNHVAILLFSSISGNWEFTSSIQGSGDCVNYINIGPQASTVLISSTNNTFTMLGYGAYPCVRITQTLVLLSPTGSLTVYENYSGTITPAFVNVDQYSNANLMLAATQVPVFGTNALLIGDSFTASYTVLYGLEIMMPTTFTELKLYCSSGLGTFTTAIFDIVNPGFNSPVIFPLGLRPYMSCPPSQALFYQATGSGTATLNYQYRYE